MSFCVNCGTQRVEGAKFCASCGTQFPAAESAETDAPRYVATSFDSQVMIVADFFYEVGGDYEDLVKAFDLGFPLAVAVVRGGVAYDGLSDLGREWITETFVAILDEWGLDSAREYSSLEQLVDLSGD